MVDSNKIETYSKVGQFWVFRITIATLNDKCFYSNKANHNKTQNTVLHCTKAAEVVKLTVGRLLKNSSFCPRS